MIGRGAWFYPGKVPAQVKKVHSPTMVDVDIDEGPGAVYRRTSITVWDGAGSPPSMAHVVMAPADDLVDLDQLAAHKAYKLPDQAPSSDDGA